MFSSRFANKSVCTSIWKSPSLEVFSRPLLSLIDYKLDEVGQMTVENDTACWYQYMDMTPQAEALFEFIKKTVEEEITEELKAMEKAVKDGFKLTNL